VDWSSAIFLDELNFINADSIACSYGVFANEEMVKSASSNVRIMVFDE
jgi:hypothetical protein